MRPKANLPANSPVSPPGKAVVRVECSSQDSLNLPSSPRLGLWSKVAVDFCSQWLVDFGFQFWRKVVDFCLQLPLDFDF